MLKSARHSHIQTVVETLGQATVGELSSSLGVSEATIRRDLEALDDLGLIQRTHGGALRAVLKQNGDRNQERPIAQRKLVHMREKIAIARTAAGLVKPYSTIFLGSGTTVEAMVPHIVDVPGLTVISNSLLVIDQLTGVEPIQLIVIGGMLRTSEQSMVGHIAEQALRELRADQSFMGMRSIDVQQGFTSDYLPEAMTDRAIFGLAARTIVLADCSKLGRVSPVFLAPVARAHTLITDSGAAADMLHRLRETGLDVISAEVSSHG